MTITVWGVRLGTDSYGNSYAMTQVVNRWSDWLTLEIKTTGGSVSHNKGIAVASPEEKRGVIYTNVVATNVLIRQGAFPFDTAYTGGRAIAAFGMSLRSLATYDTEIKSIYDLSGKRVMSLPKTFSSSIINMMLIDAGKWPVTDVIWSYGFAPGGPLRDGTIDAGTLDVNGPIGGPYVAGEDIMRLNAEKPGVRALGWPLEVIEAVRDLGFYLPSLEDLTVPAGIYGPTQTEAIYGLPTIFAWYADEALSDDVTYEIARILHQHTDYFKEVYPPASVVQEAWGRLPIPEDQFHPGSLKYFKEAGLPIGLD